MLGLPDSSLKEQARNTATGGQPPINTLTPISFRVEGNRETAKFTHFHFQHGSRRASFPRMQDDAQIGFLDSLFALIWLLSRSANWLHK